MPNRAALSPTALMMPASTTNFGSARSNYRARITVPCRCCRCPGWPDAP